MLNRGKPINKCIIYQRIYKYELEEKESMEESFRIVQTLSLHWGQQDSVKKRYSVLFHDRNTKTR